MAFRTAGRRRKATRSLSACLASDLDPEHLAGQFAHVDVPVVQAEADGATKPFSSGLSMWLFRQRLDTSPPGSLPPAPSPAHARSELAPGATGTPWRRAPACQRRPAPAVTGSLASAIPGSTSPPPGRWLPPRLTPRPPAAPVPGGPAQPRSAHHHRHTYASGIPQHKPAVARP